ncbi:hypothetical protein MCOR01_005143 [Pyricularia oryzae]|nr:hypothetical protein MCOR01_005143 [Pyricularia oryzae]
MPAFVPTATRLTSRELRPTSKTIPDVETDFVISEYSLTMPYHKCTQFQVNCVAACGLADNQCSENCRVNNPCGAASPKGASASGSAAVVAPSSTSAAPNTIQTGFAGAGGSNSNTGSGANMAAPLSLGAAITALLVAPFLVL